MDRESSKLSQNIQDIYGCNSSDITSVNLEVFKLF